MIALPSLIVANTDTVAEEWKSLYPELADKVRVIWNGYDPSDDLLAPELPARTRKTLIHTGALYGGRHAGPILASIARLMQSQRLYQPPCWFVWSARAMTQGADSPRYHRMRRAQGMD